MSSLLTQLILEGHWEAVSSNFGQTKDLDDTDWETIYDRASAGTSTVSDLTLRGDIHKANSDIVAHPDSHAHAQANTLTSPHTVSDLPVVAGSYEEATQDDIGADRNVSANSPTDDHFCVCCKRKTLSECFSTLVEKEDWVSICEFFENPAHVLSKEQRKHFLNECVKHATDSQFRDFIVPKFLHQELKSVLEVLVEKRHWESVETVLDRISHLSENEWVTVFEKACESTFTDVILIRLFGCCPESQVERALTVAISRGLWHAVSVLCRPPVSVDIQEWALEEASARAQEEGLACFNIHQLLRIFVHITSEDRQEDEKPRISNILERKYKKSNLKLTSEDIASVYVRTLLLSRENSKLKVDVILEEILRYLTDAYFVSLQDETHRSLRRMTFESYLNEFQKSVRNEFHKHAIQECFSEHAVKEGVLCFLMFGRRGQELSHNILVPLLAFQTVNTRLQQQAINQLPLVKEEVRRVLFRKAVEQQAWTVVRQFANHTLYDDQRNWALRQAVKKKKWEIALVLTDHGMPRDQLRRIYPQIARQCPVRLIRQVLERGAELEDLLECLKDWENRLKHPVIERFKKLLYLERCLDQDISTKRLQTYLHKSDWPLVLHIIRQREPTRKDHVMKAVRKAIDTGATHVLIQIVRHAMGHDQRDFFFPVALGRKLWGMVRELIECGVSRSLCTDALPELISAKQYVLVARVMELALDEDSSKQQVMKQGFEWEEGSVVVHGINVIDKQLPAGERKEMYRRAEALGMWQVIKRLAEEKDETGTEQCNLALQAAIDNHLWEVVEHCILQGAFVDQREADGNTLLHKAARIKDWKAVCKLVEYGADQSLPDKPDNKTIMQRVVHEATKPFLKTDSDSASSIQASSLTEVEYHKSNTNLLDTLYTLVQFHGDLTAEKDARHPTPWHQLLQMVDNLCQDTSMTKITDQCADIVEETLFWGKDVSKSKDPDGRTALHLLCQAGRFESLYFFVARGSDPRAVTRFGETVLLCAVRHPTESMKLVAECIKLGLTHFQPVISDAWHKYFMSQHVQSDSGTISEFTKKSINHCVTRSPFEVSIIKSNVEMMAMFYKTGACSNKELFLLNGRYNDLHNADDVSGESSNICQNGTKKPSPLSLQSLCRTSVAIEESALAYLREIAVSPRSLQSLCRIVISISLGINHRRIRNVWLLPLTISQKKFVVFAGLTSVQSARDPKPLHCYTVNTASNLALLESLAGREHSGIFRVASIY